VKRIIVVGTTSFRPRHDAKTLKSYWFLYRNLGEERISRIGSDKDLIFIEQCAALLNFSVKYFIFEDLVTQFYYFDPDPIHFSGAAVLGIFSLDSLVHWFPYSMYSLNFVDSENTKFMYCVVRDERESFDIFFWTIPLDSWTWICLCVSCIVLTFQLRGQWFQICSILMRQSCTILNRNKILIIFIFATIIFTYGYEGVISSFLTVPPPIKVFKRLRDLVVSGYKIMGINEGSLRELNELFERDNISIPINDSIVHGSYYFSDYQIKTSLSQCNTTFQVSARFEEASISSFVEIIFAQVKCHVVKHSKKLANTNYFFFGQLKDVLRSYARIWIETGLMTVIDGFGKYMANLKTMKLTKAKIVEETRLAPFEMSDWKVLSAFVGWAFRLGISMLVFILEVMFLNIEKLTERSAILWALRTIPEKLLAVLTLTRVQKSKVCGET